MVRPSGLKLAISGTVVVTVICGGTVVLGIGGGGNDLAAEGERGGCGRGDRFAAEGHAQFAGFGGDGRIDGRGEVKDQARRIVGRRPTR